MGWSGGSYTKGNAGTGGWTGDASLGIGIEASRHDTQDDDFATGINQCLNKDGSNSCTGDLNLGGFKPVNLAAGTAAAPAICAGGDVNTGIFSPAADEIGIATNGTEKIRVDSSGNVGIGTNAPAVPLDIQSTTDSQLNLSRFSNNASPPRLNFFKSLGATVGTNTLVTTGTVLGNINFYGANGTGYTVGAEIRAVTEATPGASNDMPCALNFATTSDGSGSPSLRLSINKNGYFLFGGASAVGNYTFAVTSSEDFVIGRDITGQKHIASKIIYDNGTATGANVCVESTAGSFLVRRVVSSIKYKDNVVDLDPEHADKLHQFRPVFYRSKCFGDNPHYTYYGFIAEELAEIEPRFVQFGYKPEDYEDYTYTNQDGEEKTGKRLKPDAVGEPEGVQYDRIVTFLTSIVQRQEKRIQALEAKIAELEAA